MHPVAKGTLDQADLTRSDREPIHIPGSIQPHGLLLALSEPGLLVVQASLNAATLIGVEAESILGRTVGNLFGSELSRSIVDWINSRSLDEQPRFLAKDRLAVGGGRRPFDAIIHRFDGVLILELEPSSIDEAAAFRDLYPMVRTSMTGLEGSSTVLEVCRLAADEVRRITGFDRVIIRPPKGTAFRLSLEARQF